MQEGYSNFEKIGEGGMALVYRATQDSLQRSVAIKVLLKNLGHDEEARKRFDRESYIIARLNHPNIIQVYDRGINEEDMPYFVMEYVQGTDLYRLCKERSLSHGEKVEIIIQLLKALAYAHKNNVVHRDIKPDNILIDEESNVKILDFGIAQFYQGERLVSERTTSGTVMGTYSYMSPEQKKSSDDVNNLSDIYSVGVVMYELFTGKIPAGHFPEPKQINSAVTTELNDLILQCLNPEPGQRPESAEILKTSLLRLHQGAHLDTVQTERAYKGITKIKAQFQLLDILREDQYGGVYLYQKRDQSELLIIKRKVASSPGFETTESLSALNHENIVNTLGTSKNDQHFVIVQEYIPGGTLLDKLSHSLDWQETLRIARELCSAIAFAHDNDIIHGHLRPTNILFGESGKLKVTDFGLQDDLRKIENVHYYSLQDEERSKSADIYAVGVILYQLFTGSLPRRKNEDGLVVREFFARLPEDFQTLIKSMLSTLPEGRDVEALGKAVALINNHIKDRDKTFFTEKPSRAAKRKSDKVSKLFLEEKTQYIPASPAKTHRMKAQVKASTPVVATGDQKKLRRSVLLGCLLLAFTQYFFFFDGAAELRALFEGLAEQTQEGAKLSQDGSAADQ